jgi:hypothetical protein
VDVRWITAFVDRPEASFEATVRFWYAISGSSLSPWRGVDAEFATLLPNDAADAHVRIQRTQSATSGSHIDLHVSNVDAGAEDAVRCGARVLADHGSYVVLTTPSGMMFCVVAHHGERTRQGPVAVGTSAATTVIDQVVVDVDADGFDDEVRFWSELTGWLPLDARSSEFIPLDRPQGMPLRVMVQRRNRAAGTTTCHVDLACENVAAAVTVHQALGGTVVAVHHLWTVMADPAGTEYCLTSRQPSTGTLSV